MRTFVYSIVFVLTLASVPLAAEPLPPSVASVIAINEDTFTAEIKAAYPAVLDARINRTIRTWVQNSLHEFKTTIAENSFNPGHWKYMLDIGTSLSGIPGAVLSVKFQVMYFTGGAHPNHFVTCFNFDQESGKDMLLKELFIDLPAALETIAQAARDQIRPALGDHVDEQWFMDGTAPTAENYRHFTLSPKGMTFYFPPYQMAAYVYGQQQATVGWDRFEKHLSPHLSMLLAQ